MKKIIVSALVVLISFLFCQIVSADQLSYWDEKLHRQGLSAFSLLENETQEYAWPEIELQIIEKLTPEDKEKQQKFMLLGRLVFQYLQEYQSNYADQTLSDLRAAFQTLVPVSENLSDGGGYINYLLADVCDRILLARTSFYLLNNRGDIQAVKKLLAQRHEPFDINKIIELFISSGYTDAEERLGQAPPIEFLSEVLNLLGYEDISAFRKLTFESLKTSSLLMQKNLFYFSYRVLMTKFIAEIALPGTLEFFEKGGDSEDVKIASNISRFKNVMSGSRKKYKFPYLGIKKLWPSHIRVLSEDFKKDYRESAFIQKAIQ